MSEKLPRPNGYKSESDQDTSEFYLNEINKYLFQNGFIPKFKTVEDFRISTGTTKLNVKTKLRNAYNYFIHGKTNRGQPPSEFTYGRVKPREQTENLNTKNETFNTPKMNEEYQPTGNLLQDFTKRKEPKKHQYQHGKVMLG